MEKFSKHIVAVALLFFFAHGVYSALENSVTADEYVHLPVGLSILKSGNVTMDHRGSPPLGRALLAVPDLFAGAKVDLATPAWKNGEVYAFSWEFLRNNFRAYQKLFFYPRLFGVLIGLAVIGMIAFVSSRVYGPNGGIAAAVLAASAPEFLAHAPLVATDFIGAGFFLPRSSSSRAPLKDRH